MLQVYFFQQRYSIRFDPTTFVPTTFIPNKLVPSTFIPCHFVFIPFDPTTFVLMHFSRTLMGFQTTLSIMKPQAREVFLTKTAKELIWGYDDQVSMLQNFFTSSLILLASKLECLYAASLSSLSNISKCKWSLHKLSTLLCR